MSQRERSNSMRGPRPGKARLAALGAIVVALYLMLPGVLSGAANTPPYSSVSVDPRPQTITLGTDVIAFSGVLFGSSVDSTDGTGGSGKSTDNSITITNTSATNITLLTVAYTVTIGANCGSTDTDWLPDSDNDEAVIATDKFVMYASLANNLSDKRVIPANGDEGAGLAFTGNWNSGDSPTRDLDLQLFAPPSVTAGLESCTIAFTITASSP